MMPTVSGAGLAAWIRPRRLGALAVGLVLGLTIATGALSGTAAAESSHWVTAGETRVRLLSATTGPDAQGRLRLGLEFKLAEGWKINWRSPGDAGVPPQSDWTRSDNLRFAELNWPAPHRFTLFGLQTFGYGGHLVLPVTAQVKDKNAPVRLSVDLRYLACSEICVPHQLSLALDLPAPGGAGSGGAESGGTGSGGTGSGGAESGGRGFGGAGATPVAALIDRFADWVPGDGSGHGLTLESVAQRTGPDGPVLEVAVASLLPFEAPDLIVETDLAWVFDMPAVTVSDDRRRAVLRAPAFAITDDPPALDGSWMTITVVDWVDGRPRALEQAVEMPGPTGPQLVALRPAGADAADPFGSAAAPAGAASLLAILGLALLGGLILNLMPCVLPVLSLKLLSVVGHAGGETGPVRRGFLAAAAGILFSFLILAGALIGLKAAGVAVGWGIQFQQPLFLVAIVAVLTLFAANLWGLFEISLPGFVADRLPNGRESGLAGHFLTGALATLLATPCSAPFLGTAVGFALARGPAEILLVFTALAAGLALPYLAVAALPQLATRLPRPGRWMAILKRGLAVALAVTALWLISVLGVQIGWTAAALVGGLMVVLVTMIGLSGRLGARPSLSATTATMTAATMAAAFLVPVLSGGVGGALPAGGDAAAADRIVWQPFDPAGLATAVADGNIVFVDVTADWCLTCKVNKRLVLDADAVAERLAAPVVTVRADWTRPDPEITAFLNRFDRYGIPFNVVFGPAAPDGLPLPELLSQSAVLEALDAAGAEPPDAGGPGIPGTVMTESG